VVALFVSVLLASLLGSLHCAGMCGAFLAIAMSDTGVPAWRLSTMYHLGRLTTYLALGVLAGGLGGTVNLAGSIAGMQRSAAALSAAVILVFGVLTLMRHFGYSRARVGFPPVLLRISEAGHRAAMSLPGDSRAMSIGLLTTLLPCGWLYAFVGVAAGSASMTLGPAIMFTFWLGTLPVMAAMSVGARSLVGPLQRFAPVVASISLIAMGGLTLVHRSDGLGDLPASMRLLFVDRPSARSAGELTGMVQAAGDVPVCHAPAVAKGAGQ